MFLIHIVFKIFYQDLNTPLHLAVMMFLSRSMPPANTNGYQSTEAKNTKFSNRFEYKSALSFIETLITLGADIHIKNNVRHTKVDCIDIKKSFINLIIVHIQCIFFIDWEDST